VSQFHFFADGYLDLMHSEVPDYELLEDTVAAATVGIDARRVLDLGVGTGETLRRVATNHPEAELVGIDESDDMMAAARTALPAATLRNAHLEDELPAGPFDLVISALAVHHLDGPGKADLFRRVAAVIRPGGRFVLGDLIVPDDPSDAVTPIDGVYDKPDRLDAQLEWLADAGFEPTTVWIARDLAVVRADLGTVGS
jgi:tRNA (cmo5U34)-methyltransferase